MAGSWKGGWYGGLALIALSLLIGLSGLFSLPVVDRDEARFAQASRQMLEAATLPADELDPALHGGGWAVPMLGDRPRLNKPPLIYWLQAASAWVFTGGDVTRDAIWMYRAPSALALIVIVLLTWRIGLEMFGWPTAFLGACMIATSPVFVWESHQARADMVLVAVTCVAMWGLWGVWGGKRKTNEETKSRSGGMWGRIAAMWIGIGLGVLVKGPITPMVVGLTALMLSVYGREWRWIMRAKPVVGVVVVIGMVAPWVWAVGEQVGWSEYTSIVFAETLGRSASAMEGHWGPPGYHLVLMVVLFWPGSMLTGVAFVRAAGMGLGRSDEATGRQSDGGWVRRVWAWFVNRRVTRSAEAFCVAWIVPSWIVFELVSTKLPHYTMPLYPALALISARGVHWAMSGAMQGAQARWPRIGQYAWTSFPMFVGLPCLGAAWFVAVTPPMSAGAVAALLVFALVSFAAALRLIADVRDRSWLAASRVGVIYGAALGVLIVGIAIPGVSFIWPTRSMERALRQVDPSGERPVAIMGYREDSVRFLFRGRPLYLEPGEGDAWLADNDHGVLLEFGAGARAERDGAELVDIIHGFNFGGGDHVMFAVWVNER